MATMTIRLETDPETHKRIVAIAYKGDEDAMPLEHEEEHRHLVEQLVAGLADVRIERESAKGGPVSSGKVAGANEREGLKQGR